jgi:hypothetical protein
MKSYNFYDERRREFEESPELRVFMKGVTASLLYPVKKLSRALL